MPMSCAGSLERLLSFEPNEPVTDFVRFAFLKLWMFKTSLPVSKLPKQVYLHWKVALEVAQPVFLIDAINIPGRCEFVVIFNRSYRKTRLFSLGAEKRRDVTRIEIRWKLFKNFKFHAAPRHFPRQFRSNPLGGCSGRIFYFKQNEIETTSSYISLGKTKGASRGVYAVPASLEAGISLFLSQQVALGDAAPGAKTAPESGTAARAIKPGRSSRKIKKNPMHSSLYCDTDSHIRNYCAR